MVCIRNLGRKIEREETKQLIRVEEQSRKNKRKDGKSNFKTQSTNRVIGKYGCEKVEYMIVHSCVNALFQFWRDLRFIHLEGFLLSPAFPLPLVYFLRKFHKIHKKLDSRSQTEVILLEVRM